MNRNLFVIRSTVLFGSLLLTACQSERFVQGKRLYEAHCQSCHLENGKGLGELYPALPLSTYLSSNVSELPCLIISGKKSTKLATLEMPANPHLSDAELLNLMNYMMTSFVEKEPLSPKTLKTYLSDCPEKD